MTHLNGNSEELFRFATTRAPSAVPASAGLLELADDSDVATWLEHAGDQDCGAELVALQSHLHLLNSGDHKALDAFLSSAWKYYLQGISNGKANPTQLRCVQELMAEVTRLKSGDGGEPSAYALRLPAAFDTHRRGAAQAPRAMAAAQAVPDAAAERSAIEARLAQLTELERGLMAALDRAPPSQSPVASAVPLSAAAPGVGGERTSYLLPAADPGLAFRQANDSLVHALHEAQIPTAGLSCHQLLGEVRRQAADLTLQASRLPTTAEAAPPPRFSIRAAGVADLRIVRHVLLGYEKGDLAQIENVIQGETRKRSASRLQRSDEGRSDYAEGELEQQRGAFQFDRSEAGLFSYETERQSEDRNNSINITANYGEVNITASAFSGSSRGSDEVRGEDQRRSRERVDQALALARNRVGQFRYASRTTEQYDTVVHKQKAKCGNVVAQYRWVDKVYRAQVYHYGARAMYEFTVPAPAANFLQMLAKQPGVSPVAGPAPVRPAITPAEITDSNWIVLAQHYDVNLPAPPVQAITEYAQVSYPAPGQLGTTISGVFAHSPAQDMGYQACSAGVAMTWVGPAGACGVNASVGTLLFTSGAEPGGPIPPQDMHGETTEVTYSATGWGPVEQFSVNFYLVWTRTDRALEHWQLAAYRQIMEAYETKLAAWREQQAVVLEPALMRSIERTELKRAILATVRRSEGDADELAKEVRFFETAFEWDQMIYTFHPYYWSAESAWNVAQFGQQGDSVFNAFLSASFATVVVPVRAGYEDAVAIYLETGIVIDVPVTPSDEAVASMNREVRQINAAAEDGGVAEGEPWTYRVPTTLMVLDENICGPLPQLAQ